MDLSQSIVYRNELGAACTILGIYLMPFISYTPVSFGLKIFFTRWKLNPKSAGIDSLKNAGNWIGIIERLLVFVFIVVGQFGAVGFLLAAKSVFRFGDLNRESNMKLTEYVLIGTLLSFGIAILTGIAFQQILGL